MLLIYLWYIIMYMLFKLDGVILYYDQIIDCLSRREFSNFVCFICISFYFPTHLICFVVGRILYSKLLGYYILSVTSLK